MSIFKLSLTSEETIHLFTNLVILITPLDQAFVTTVTDVSKSGSAWVRLRIIRFYHKVLITGVSDYNSHRL
jgi:hypothetical protein